MATDIETSEAVEAAVAVEAVVLHRDHGQAQGGGHLIEGDVAPVLVEGEPGPAVGAVEDGVAHAAGEAVDVPGALGVPGEDDGAPQHDELGVLGIGTPEQAGAKLLRQARDYARPGRPVLPAHSRKDLPDRR